MSGAPHRSDDSKKGPLREDIAAMQVEIARLREEVADLKQKEAELDRARRQITRISEALPIVAFQITLERSGTARLTFINSRTRDILGIDADALVQAPEKFQDLLPDSERERLEAHYRESYRTKEPIYGRYDLLPGRCPAETIRIRAAWEIAADGSRWYLTGYVADITEDRRSRDALLEARHRADQEADRARRADQAKSSFLATMSHEIRTPLTSVVGFIDLLRLTGVDEEQRDYLDNLDRASQSLLTIVQDVLDFSKIEAGRVDLACEPMDVDLELASIADMVRPRAENKNLELRVDCGLPVGPQHLGDAVRLRQIAGNLLVNAIKFTKEGSISLRSGRKANGHVFFEVADTGPGIAPDLQHSLFEPFTQERRYQALGPSEEGAGLGLAISERLVRAMGGHIFVCSQPGEGTLFHIDLPLPLAPEAPEGGQEVREPPALADSSDPGDHVRPDCLLIDDHATNRTVMGAILKRAGIPVDMAHDGHAALDALKSKTYNLLLVDIQMPGMDGIELVRRIRSGEVGAHYRNVHCIAVTAHALQGDRERFIQAGMDDYLPKPIRLAALREALQRWREARRQAPPLPHE